MYLGGNREGMDMGRDQRKAERPQGEVRIVGEIRHDLILGPEQSDCQMYEYQEEYALLLWALQEKVGLTFDEATFVCYDKLRTDWPWFSEEIFGMDFDEYGAWFEYFKSLLSGVDLTRYIGKIEPNLWEGNGYQWFRGGSDEQEGEGEEGQVLHPPVAAAGDRRVHVP